MGTVYRNGQPPKNMPFKIIQEYSDYEFSEELITNWARQQCSGHVQYDFIIFNHDKMFKAKTIQLTLWFQRKADAELFRQNWMN